jgi:hypothetical protein
MQRFRPPGGTPVAATALVTGAVLVALLAGCNGTATTRNGVTPGPPLPSGMTAPSDAFYFPLQTTSETP